MANDADATAILPALLPEQWAALRAYTADWYAATDDTWLLDAYLANQDNSPTYRPNGWDNEAIVMALANAALPDDDPRKITRGDVQLLDDARRWIDKYPEPFDHVTMARIVKLRNGLETISGKLAALLPPE